MFCLLFWDGILKSSQAFTLVLEGVVRDETNAVALAKLLLSCFVIRGSQLSIVRRLDGQYVVQVHSTLLTWITKRIAVYESNKNKNGLRSSITFFRVLLPLLGVIESRDALKMSVYICLDAGQLANGSISVKRTWTKPLLKRNWRLPQVRAFGNRSELMRRG